MITRPADCFFLRYDGVDVKLTVSAATQFAAGAETTDYRNLVGSTHTNPDPPYNYFNLWLRYTVTFPRRCRGVKISLSYGAAYNSDAILSGQIFRYSFGTASAPGTEFSTFVWDTANHVATGLTLDGNFDKNEQRYFWLHYNFAGQNNCYASGVVAEITGNALGVAKIGTGSDFCDGMAFVADGEGFAECEIYMADGNDFEICGG